MPLATQVGIAILSALISGIVSYFVSRRVAVKTAEKQYDLQSKRDRLEWHKQANKLATRTEDDWWEVVNSGEKDYEVDAVEIFTQRRDELREHAAEGRALNVDSGIIQEFEQAAADLDVAVNELDSGKKLAEIENNVLESVDDLDDETQERIAELS